MQPRLLTIALTTAGSLDTVSIVKGENVTSGPRMESDPNAFTTSRDKLNNHLDYIENQCRRAVRRLSGGSPAFSAIDLENESLELFNRVIDRIRENDYAVIRRFDGRSRFTTYLTALISRQAVEEIRRRKGRSRARQRAQTLGRLGLNLFEKIFSRGLNISEAMREVQLEGIPGVSEEQLARMADHIVGQDGVPAPFIISMEKPPDCPDSPGRTPENLAIEREQRERLTEAVDRLRSELSGADRLLLRLRFPPDMDSSPRKASEIAAMLHTSRKAVYRRLDRLLPRCRDILEKSGLSGTDLLADLQGNSPCRVRQSNRRSSP